ncbi:MAG: rod shape-determining protein RodA [Anaerolineales bacterium]|nr:rod shape-determining protein RodA [Anaerolineales bacterium]MCB8954761.1 rod shape-determining protein RodA [Ardenticatenales bacterium]
MSKTSVWRHFDLWLAAAIVLLTAFGILIQKSAVTGAPDLEPLPNRQILWAIAGITAMLIISAIDYRILTAGHWYIYLGLVASLLLVVLIGQINNEARRWFDFGFFQLQPSEFGRIFIALTFAQFLGQRLRLMNRFSNTILSLIYIALPIGLIFIEPDLGMSILYFIMWFVMIWMAGLPLSHFAILGSTGLVGALLVVPRLAPYQQERLLAFVNPEAVPEQAFNVNQALIAIGSGGPFGKGYFQGTQSQLGFLRVQHTDFIFAVLVEEFGFVFGALLVVGLMGFILQRILRVASMTRDPAGRLACVGIAGVLFFQTVVSIGMNLRILPVTGLTLPFVSYGGSSLLTWYMAMGVVQSIRMRHRKQEFG